MRKVRLKTKLAFQWPQTVEDMVAGEKGKQSLWKQMEDYPG